MKDKLNGIVIMASEPIPNKTPTNVRGYLPKDLEMNFEKIPCEKFDAVFRAMTENFDSAERRDYEDARLVLERQEYSILLITEGGHEVGFMAIWELPDFTFLEHFVIFKEFRNSGLGAQALGLLQSRGRRIVLEAEPPCSDMQKRRIAFYERSEFIKNERDYIQPPYRQGDLGVPLVIMSFPHKLSDFDFDIEILKKTVYGV